MPDEEFQLDPESIAALERATQAAEEENATYDRLFGKPKPVPLTEEQRDIYEALYGPGSGVDE
jgi:hypothetical protein